MTPTIRTTRTGTTTRRPAAGQGGIALIAVLVALTMLLLLALPFAVSMSRGADAAMHAVETAQAEQLSASVRDELLQQAALGHPTFDPTPTYDERSEWPDAAPATFPELRRDGRVRLGGEVVDLQRFLPLEAASPLLFANVLGTAARLAKDLDKDASVIQLDDAGNLPESGFVWIDHELVHYDKKQGSALLDLRRGLLQEQGLLRPEDHVVAETALVLDFRSVLAACWSFDGRTGGTRRERKPLHDAHELGEVESAGFGGFTPTELDLLAMTFAGDSALVTAPTFGRPERVFDPLLLQPRSRTLRVKSALHLGPGSSVRLRNLHTGAAEYGLVMSTSASPVQRELLLPSEFRLELLWPVTQEFPAIDTVVEPLLPAPVDVNTADARVLAAIFANIRRSSEVRVHDDSGKARSTPQPPITRTEARDLAEQIVALRGGTGDQEGPFAGWQELCERLFKPRFEQASGLDERGRWVEFYRDLLTGRDSRIEMGTVPLCFQSGPLVAYRAAASLQRSAVAPGIAARHERTGIAIALPGYTLQQPWQTQEQLEEAFRIDQRAPWWLTLPINTCSTGIGEAGNDPSSRVYAHIIGMAYPQMGLGEPRFPSRDRAAAAFQPEPASVAPIAWAQERRGHEAFATDSDPRGHDVSRDGPFRIRNTGPRDTGAPPAPERTHQLTFPFTVANGFAGRFATSFWAEPEALSGTLLDYSDGNKDRNRMTLLVRDANVVFEVIDEAGIDPDPSASLAGVQRSASQVLLPLAELGLPGRTPVHFAVSAYADRPNDLSVAVDGITRGKARYRTYLTAPLPVYDPSIRPAGPPAQANTNDPRFVDVTVDSTDGFPPEGVLRIGLELFEYATISGNTFVCRFVDSLGGRGGGGPGSVARQRAREMRPNVPVDSNGNPTVDIEQLQQQGVNIDVFPEHPVGSEVELYGYSSLLSPDTFTRLGQTALDGSLGGWAVARGFVPNGRTITLTAPPLPPIMIGAGLDTNSTDDIVLAQPPTSTVPMPDINGNQGPPDAPKEILDAFPQGGGYALLVQWRLPFDPPLGAVGTSVDIGGVEVIKYGRRDGKKLTGIQRAQRLPGDDSAIRRDIYDGTARQFVTDWALVDQRAGQPRPTPFDQYPQLVLWVVPISLSVQNTDVLANPEDTGTSEWLQFYPRGDVNDTEWVRYDLLHERRYVVRSNRGAWQNAWFQLTHQTGVNRVQLGPGGANNNTTQWSTDPSAIWGTITPTSGYIGYTPKIESTYPEISAARQALGYRGDPFAGTGSHPQTNSTLLPCHRLQLHWGNHGALTGRPGRNDRVTLIGGSKATGTTRPPIEWHTVNWCTRRYSGDVAGQNGKPPSERLGPEPFQVCAFQDAVTQVFAGAASGNQVTDVRRLDRLVKFPSGELPAAFSEAVTVGGAVAGGETMAGMVDEIDVTDQLARDVVVDESFTASAQTFTVSLAGSVAPEGLHSDGRVPTAEYPTTGGLVLVDTEIIAYQSQQNGGFQIATNGRGLLGTDPRGHDRGARVRFLTHRPAAILTEAVQSRTDRLPVQALGAMPPVMGTALLGRHELVHYCWARKSGDAVAFEMPRRWPPGEDGDSTGSTGLFRGRYGTAPVGAGSGEPLIAFPFRYWDRHVERSDDPEQSYFQLTTREAPVFFRTLAWRQETQDIKVQVVCLVRVDGHGSFRDEPNATPFLRLLSRDAAEDKPTVLGLQATQLEVRFAVLYRPGAIDLETWRAHAWKTAPHIKDVRLEYEGESRVLAERTTQR